MLSCWEGNTGLVEKIAAYHLVHNCHLWADCIIRISSGPNAHIKYGLPLHFYRAMLAQSAVMRLHVVCLSVRL